MDFKQNVDMRVQNAYNSIQFLDQKVKLRAGNPLLGSKSFKNLAGYAYENGASSDLKLIIYAI